MNIMKQLEEWAEMYVPKFNAMSEKYQTGYYTQSPLDIIDHPIDTLIAGINPKGNKGNGCTIYEPDKFIKGNPFWDGRFLQNGTYNKEWGKYVSNTRFFLGFSNNQRDSYFDDDAKTVWTNLSPFESKHGSSDLPKELESIGIHAFFELVGILKPKRIVLLGTNAFAKLKKYDNSHYSRINYRTVIDNCTSLKIGRINEISTVSVPHPSGRQWPVSNKFIPVFIFLFFLSDRLENGKVIRSLDDVASGMKNEMKAWMTRIQFNDTL